MVGGFGTEGIVITDIIRVVIADANDIWNIPEDYELVIMVIQFCFCIFKNRLLGLIMLMYSGVFKSTRAFVTV